YTSTVVLPQGTYYWQVTAKDAAGNITPSASRSFGIFIGTGPVNGAFVPTGKPMFTWTAVPGATGYDIEITTDPTFVTITRTQHVGALPVPSFTLTVALPPAMTYYWRVRKTGEVPVSVLYRTLFVAPAAVPAAIAPLGGTLSNLTPNLSWTAVTPPIGVTLLDYEVQIATNATFTAGVQTFPPVTTTNLTTPGLTTGLTYSWRVRARFGLAVTPAPGPFSIIHTFFVDVLPPAKPVLLAPADKASVTLPPLPPAPPFKFTWNTVPGAVRYDFRYGTSTAMDITVSVAQLTTPGFVPSFTPPSPLLNTTYYWQVRAYDAGGNSDPVTSVSVMRSVKILSAANAVPVLNRFTSVPVTLTWGPISWVSPSGHYELLVANNINFVNPKFTNLNIQGTQTIDVPSLTEGTWYWKVLACTGPRATLGTTCGVYSSTGTFTVDP
ncbi:MAG: hypothetical protein ABI970_02145, partial [Chloroflexota bacterium]